MDTTRHELLTFLDHILAQTVALDERQGRAARDAPQGAAPALPLIGWTADRIAARTRPRDTGATRGDP